ncbi:MAG: amino acid adenylation domain-containing protein, partial [Hyphomicrobiales bacterium]
WNDTSVPRERTYSIHGLFEAQAARTPDAVALVVEDDQLTYAELNAKANRLAHHLMALGVRPDSLVALCLERSVHMVVALLAVLKAGGAYVPLDPKLPRERLAGMLEDCEAVAVLSQASLLEQLPAGALALDTLALPGGADAQRNPQVPFHPSQLAYCIYTSGSTGKPKGAMNAHEAVVNRMLWMNETYGLNAADVVLQKTPYAFDVSVWEFFCTLATGARLVMAKPQGHMEPHYLAQTIVEQGVTLVHFVPSMLQVFLEADVPMAGHRLRQMFCSGEALPASLMKRCLAAFPQMGLDNLYGPTEAAVDVLAWHCEDNGSDRVPLGHAIANVQIHVVNPSLQPVPLGVAGEIAIAGVAPARGYLRRGSLTAEKFVPDPFGQPGGRMYLTGDLGRRMPDGQLEYLGRIDQQVKIRGFRIELGEIEATLRGLPQVGDAVVLAREDRPGDKRLVAYVVAQQDDQGLDAQTLRENLARTLPDYMVPAQIMQLQAMPLSPNGKIDKRALPVPELIESDTEYVAPRTQAETLLAGIWAEVLKVEQVGIHDNFFALGGHSLLAMRLVSRIRSELAIDLPLATVFDTPTLAHLASQVDMSMPASALQAIPVADRDIWLPLSFTQQRMWFLHNLEPTLTTYHVPLTMRISGALDIDALQRAYGEVISRHEILRTTFRTVEGRPVPVISEAPVSALSSAPPSLMSLADLSKLDAASRESLIAQMIEEEGAVPFDLVHGPLIRACLVRLGSSEHILLATMHHITSDGWSVELLLEELSVLYSAFAAGETSPLAPLPLQYADYAAWQRQHLTPARLGAQVQYWKRQLTDAPTLLMLPTDRPRPAVQQFDGARVDFSLSHAVTAALIEIGQSHHATLFMTLTAAYGVLLSRHAGQRDVCIGAPVAGRQRADLQELIGPFINLVVLRCEVNGATRFEDLLDRVRATVLDAYDNQDLPFESLIEELKLERHLSHTPLFQALFQMESDRSDQIASALEIEPLALRTRTSKFDVSFFAREAGGELHCSLEYKTSLFDASTMARMAGNFKTLLEGIASAPQTPVGDLPLLDAGELRRIVGEWNDTAADLPDMGLHTRFEQHAALYPDATAVVVGEALLSYAEVNLQANRLAHLLRQRGVGPEVKVGVCIERSTDLIVALIAVLKAGGAYVPLDASFPMDRLAFMVADSKAAMVLTHAALRDTLQELPAVLVCLDELQQELASHASTNPRNLADGENLAYVIYTSGSTGRPKGVQITHRGIANYLHWGMDAYPMAGGEQGSFTHLPLIFDASLTTLFIPLWAGKDVHLPMPGGHEQIIQPMRQAQSLSMVKITPAHIDLMAAALQPDEVHTQIRTSVIGGDILTPTQVRTWLRYFPDTIVINEYGPTETVVGCCTERIDAAEQLADCVLIGKPIANMQHYILDARGHPVPPGVQGELHIAGFGVARGYLSRAALTAEKFVPDPFGPPGRRMYRTGDLSRYWADGRIEFMGRIDNQVKIRGFRIELGEIEAAIVALEGVREAVVLVHAGHDGQKQLVGYLVAEDGVGDPVAWRLALAQTLPDYMVPAHMMVLDELPLTPSGKIDRKALAAPGEYESGSVYVEPTNDTERSLAQLWAEVLGLSRVGIHDNFFAIGGNSLLTVQLAAHVTRQFAVTLPLTLIFEAQTIEHMARYVDEIRYAQSQPAMSDESNSTLKI